MIIGCLLQLAHGLLQESQDMVRYRENRAKLEEAVDQLQKQFRDMQHDRQKCALEIKVTFK